MFMLFFFIFYYFRVKTNPKNAINEHFLPRFLDFIVWGHEHECLVDPQVPLEWGFLISFLVFTVAKLNSS